MARGESADRDQGRAEAGAARTGRAQELTIRTFATHRLVAAAIIAAGTFLLYHATLLPGFDFGDTGSFQVMAGSSVITPRDAYPLYFALGDIVVRAAGGDPARALNLASAIEAAIACGLLVLVAAEFSGSTVAGVAGAVLFAGSYTFWSQAVIAEVYALHMALVALTLLLLLWWSHRPTRPRLALFFGAYALGFGNHLSMVLLAPAYTVFLMLAAPRRWRDVLNVRVIVMAGVIAFCGSLQYLWNLRSLWLSPTPPRTFAAAMNSFWFDVTKVDWRSTTVMGIPSGMLGERLRMYQFDVGQQFGSMALALAIAGALYLLWTSPRRATLVLVAFAVNFLFAFSYNVGDSHVFFLPSHLLIAVLIACGTALCGRAASAAVGRHAAWTSCAVGAVVIALGVARGRHNYPALDRSNDRRPTAVLAAISAGLDDRRDILLTNLNWQQENGLNYFSKDIDRDLAWSRLSDVTAYLPALVQDNLAIGRSVALTEHAREGVAAQLTTPLVSAPLAVTRDERILVPSLDEVTGKLPRGTRYVICMLDPSREFPVNQDDLGRAIGALTAGTRGVPGGKYAVVAGLTGQAPSLAQSSDRPFRATASLGGVGVEVRMESWLAFDTIRRMGFAQVVAARHHALIVERGVSFVALDQDGAPLATAYAGNIFAPQPRYIVRAP